MLLEPAGALSSPQLRCLTVLLCATVSLVASLGLGNKVVYAQVAGCDQRGVVNGTRFMIVELCEGPDDSTGVPMISHGNGAARTLSFDFDMEPARAKVLKIGAAWWGQNDGSAYCRPTSGYVRKDSSGWIRCRNCVRTRDLLSSGGCDCGGSSGEGSCNGWNFVRARGGLVPPIPGAPWSYLDVSRTALRSGCYSSEEWYDHPDHDALTCPQPSVPCNRSPSCPN